MGQIASLLAVRTFFTMSRWRSFKVSSSLFFLMKLLVDDVSEEIVSPIGRWLSRWNGSQRVFFKRVLPLERRHRTGHVRQTFLNEAMKPAHKAPQCYHCFNRRAWSLLKLKHFKLSKSELNLRRDFLPSDLDAEWGQERHTVGQRRPKIFLHFFGDEMGRDVLQTRNRSIKRQ